MTLDVRELIRRLRAGQTNRAIAREMGVARKTAAKYRSVAAAEGLLTGALPDASSLDRLLEGRMAESALPRQPWKAAPYRSVIEDLRGQGVEIKALHARLREDHGFEGSYSALRRYVVHLEQTAPRGYVRLETPAGQEAQVDFGSAGKMADPETGEVKKAWVFVMTLSFSRHQYAEVVFDQKVETWLRCHRHAFEYLGGVPSRIVVDNLKAAIVKAALHDPVVQRSYRQLAEHYGFLISPCRPRTPEHKGKVESGVHYVKRNFLAGRGVMSLTECNTKLLRWIEETAGRRCHGTTKQQPLPLFRRLEQSRLQPLPSSPYDLGVWKRVKVHPDCHVVIDGAYYSAPHRLIGRQVWARTNGRDVHLFHEYERIASHRWGRAGVRRTIADHYPPDKQAYLMSTPSWCRRRSAEIGPSCRELIDRLLSERPLDRLRAAQAVLRLADRHAPARLEAACRRALFFGETSHRTLKRILDDGLDHEPLPAGGEPVVSETTFAFARPGSELFPTTEGVDHGH
ncbi:IS21 family transposase [bacterium]|nr:IS21 family transposase [bacterium]